MKFRRRQLLHLAAGAAALPAMSRIAKAQSYPAKPVRLINGYAPGGTGDITARLMAQWLSDQLGQPFIASVHRSEPSATDRPENHMQHNTSDSGGRRAVCRRQWGLVETHAARAIPTLRPASA
jgi:hypothetical protein